MDILSLLLFYAYIAFIAVWTFTIFMRVERKNAELSKDSV